MVLSLTRKQYVNLCGHQDRMSHILILIDTKNKEQERTR